MTESELMVDNVRTPVDGGLKGRIVLFPQGLERKKYNYLNEVMDLSRQMGEALDRGDEVSMQMLLADSPLSPGRWRPLSPA
mgnify:CR=1 FL=1